MRDTIYQLFGDKSQASSTIIPSRLGALSEKAGINFDLLLNGHTIFPFLTTFAAQKNIDTVTDILKNNQKGAFYSLLGLFNYCVKPEYLRFCPLCYQEELQNFGEAYWHRLHQTPGALACEKHFIRLIDSKILYDAKGKRDYLTLTSTESILNPQIIKSVTPPLLTLIKAIQYLYENSESIRKLFCSYYNDFSPLFLHLLQERGYATQNGSIHHELLISEFNKFLKIAQINFYDNESWIIRICRKEKITWDPVKYILAGTFLCGTFENFLHLAEQHKNHDFSKVKLAYNKCYESEIFEMYRIRWIDARKHAKNDTRNSIIKQDQAAYLWLFRHDRQWLIENSPLPQFRGGNKKFADWKTRDTTYAMQVTLIANQLYSTSTKPMWVSKTAICQRIGLNCNILNSGQLPLTEKNILNSSESREQFRYRKISWVISEFRKKRLPMMNWRILKAAGIRDENWKNYHPLIENLLSGENQQDNAKNANLIF
jgi:hypothetical protein